LLAQKTQKNISVYSREFEEAADLEPFDVLSDGDFSSPADAVITRSIPNLLQNSSQAFS
jgi:hypothetical protein